MNNSLPELLHLQQNYLYFCENNEFIRVPCATIDELIINTRFFKTDELKSENINIEQDVPITTYMYEQLCRVRYNLLGTVFKIVPDTKSVVLLQVNEQMHKLSKYKIYKHNLLGCYLIYYDLSVKHLNLIKNSQILTTYTSFNITMLDIPLPGMREYYTTHLLNKPYLQLHYNLRYSLLEFNKALQTNDKRIIDLKTTQFVDTVFPDNINELFTLLDDQCFYYIEGKLYHESERPDIQNLLKLIPDKLQNYIRRMVYLLDTIFIHFDYIIDNPIMQTELLKPQYTTIANPIIY